MMNSFPCVLMALCGKLRQALPRGEWLAILIACAVILVPFLTAISVGQTITNHVTDLAKLQPVPKIVVTDELPDAWWGNVRLLQEWARVTGAITVRYDADLLTWMRARIAKPKVIAVLFSPYHCENGKLQGMCLRERRIPIGWEDQEKYRLAWFQQCRVMAQLAGGIPVLILFDYEYGIPDDVDGQQMLGKHLENFYYAAKREDAFGDNVKCLWYRSHHYDYHGHPRGFKSRPATPPGIPCDYGNAEWFCPLDHYGLVGAVEHAYLQDINKPLSVAITLGQSYIPKETWGGKLLQPMEYDPMFDYRTGQELFATNPNKDPGRWCPALTRVEVIWLEGFRHSPWPHVLAFIRGGQTN